MKHLLNLSLLGGIGASAAALGDVHVPFRRSDGPSCSAAPQTLALSDPPYDNYFYSDCNVAAHAVVTSPLPDSDLTRIGPRLIVAWPAGNSGICTFYEPQNGINGTLAIDMVNSTIGRPLAPVYHALSGSNPNPSVGVQGVLRFNSSATLTLPIMGSIRTIRDFTEGGSILYPEIQNAIKFISNSDGSATLQYRWLDNVTTTSVRYTPRSSGSNVTVNSRTINFEAGDYLFSTEMNYPQMEQLSPAEALNQQSAGLITSSPDETTALSFLSYSEKLLAGTWRFLTYFGRDSMIAGLLMEPVLSNGNGSAIEAVIGSVLERVDRTDGSACHEETIGDYATWLNMQEGIDSNAMICDYKMVDTDYFLPVLMQRYFLENPVGRKRAGAFFSTPAGSVNRDNKGLTWGQLAQINADRIMRLAAPFAHVQTKDNLIHLKAGEIVGEWRDSTYGLGGGRIPYNVNAALVPAALRSVAALSRKGIYSQRSWAVLADKYAQVWEDNTLGFFEVTIPQADAQTLVKQYKTDSSFAGPDMASSIDTDVVFHALALDSDDDDVSIVKVMNTDDCFRHYLLNTTNDAQLTRYLNNSATNVRRTFPAGLMTDASMVVANPAFGGEPVYARNFTAGAYHGTVVWSWQLAMMAKGFEQQMARCNGSFSAPAFCADSHVFGNVKAAYNTLWDSIEANEEQLAGEVWSWVYKDGEFQVTPLGVMPPPPGTPSQTESDIRQLWFLSFLAVHRNKAYK